MLTKQEVMNRIFEKYSYKSSVYGCNTVKTCVNNEPLIASVCYDVIKMLMTDLYVSVELGEVNETNR